MTEYDHAKELAEAARKASSARRDLHATIRTAVKAGMSLRTVAGYAGVSYETVRRIAG